MVSANDFRTCNPVVVGSNPTMQTAYNSVGRVRKNAILFIKIDFYKKILYNIYVI